MWIYKALEMQSTTPLDKLALNDHSGQLGFGLGYKSANLIRLQEQADVVTQKCSSCRVEVPAFLPIGDFELQFYLQTHYSELIQKWNEFKEQFGQEAVARFRAGDGQLILTDHAKDILDRIQKRIQECFEKFPYESPKLKEWLDKHSPQFIIVRSTGKEDSETNTNAGGNASIPFIRPDPVEISKAMGEVIQSYFGEKSILQRLAARDCSIFDEQLFIPVLIQKW